MRETRYYCDVCGKEIKQDPHNTYINVTARAGRHGVIKRNLVIMDCNRQNVHLDFCEDCKGTIALLFSGASLGEKTNEANETD